jgi:hypothetical protein
LRGQIRGTKICLSAFYMNRWRRYQHGTCVDRRE